MAEQKHILVLNCGSSSLKYEVIRMPDKVSLGKGLVERIGSPMGILTQKSPKGKIEYNVPFENHKAAMAKVVEALTDKEKGLVSDISQIKAIGHRVVHGGEQFAGSVKIDEKVISALRDNIALAPLHNPANITGIEEAEKLLPGVPMVGVFDTAFHQTMPKEAYLYGLPRELYDKFKIRRYGFHGTSHRYVAARAAEIVGKKLSDLNIITCHLGNGASLTAIKNGKSIDTSMGFTPLEGLVMGTRSGDFDPAIIGFLEDKGYTSKEVTNIINKKSGLLGLSGISNDMRDIEKAASEGNKNAEEALDIFALRVKKYIGAYYAELGKVDIILFTGGVGENGKAMREKICRGLEGLGIEMDYAKNKETKEGSVSMQNSKVEILIVPTNEELQIAIDTYDIAFN